MADENPPPAATSRSNIAAVRLPPFWQASPANWFLQAEAQFAIREITQPVDKYYLVMSALSELQVDMVSSVLRPEPDQESYGRLKAALVASHTMMEYQKVDKLMAMEPLGGRKPTELLAAMQKLRPSQDEAFFAWAFIQRLPREVRVLLAQDDTSDMRKIAEKADALVALHQPQHHDVAAVAAVGPAAENSPSADEDTVAAATARGKGKAGRGGRSGKKKQKGGRCRCSQSPFDIHQSPLCYFHVRYGEKAYKCVEPCAWPEN
jgi:hypothetical protein